MKTKKIINKCHELENIRILDNYGKLIWQGYVLDLKRGYPLDCTSYFILNSKVLGLRPTKIKIDNIDQIVVLDIYIKRELKK